MLYVFFIFFENFHFLFKKKSLEGQKKIRGGRFELPTNGWLRLRTLQSTALPLSYPRTSALDQNTHQDAPPSSCTLQDILHPAGKTCAHRSFAVQGHALSLPVSLVGQDRWLSPTRPGFNSRTGNGLCLQSSVGRAVGC